MTWARRVTHRVARRLVGALPPPVREVALALGARAVDGPALLPGPPQGPVLVIAPHPDDETIGAGGAIIRHVAQGDRVTVLVATSGDATSGGGKGVALIREAECRAACAILGAPPPVFVRLPDGRLGEHAASLAAAIAQHGREVRTVYVPSILDPHRDHRSANAALASAALGADVYGYEVWQAAAVDVVLDITDVYAAKEAALSAYATALETVDYVRAARGLAAYRSMGGGLGGNGLAEGFLRLSASEHADLTRRVMQEVRQ